MRRQSEFLALKNRQRTYSPRIVAGILFLIVISAAQLGCSSYRINGGRTDAQRLVDEANDAIRAFRRSDPTMSSFFRTATAWVVFPEVTQGGIAIGAAHGRGVVFANGGRVVGYASVTQGSVGVQLGGQTFSQIIFIRDSLTLDRFKRGEAEFLAQASAVAVSSGAAGKADYADGVAIFVTQQQGLMFDASIGGQKFKFEPAEAVE
ncbi:MAG: hypothetical protein GC164_01010 [Phycisphaera sp.]|nr:hypothetical protein [Phycisphaera sp.]